MSEAAVFLDEFADFITVAHGHEDTGEPDQSSHQNVAHCRFAIADGNYIDITPSNANTTIF